MAKLAGQFVPNGPRLAQLLNKTAPARRVTWALGPVPRRTEASNLGPTVARLRRAISHFWGASPFLLLAFTGFDRVRPQESRRAELNTPAQTAKGATMGWFPAKLSLTQIHRPTMAEVARSRRKKPAHYVDYVDSVLT